MGRKSQIVMRYPSAHFTIGSSITRAGHILSADIGARQEWHSLPPRRSGTSGPVALHGNVSKMADAPPLFFERRLGGLFPACPAAEKALAAVNGRVRLKITRTQGNNKRLALYWITLGIAAPMLDEQAPGLTDKLLHNVLKDRAGLVKIVTLPSGDRIKDYESISFATMTEPERASFIDFAFKTLSAWLGCSVEELTNEAKDAA